MDLVRSLTFPILLFAGSCLLQAQVTRFAISQVRPQLPIMTVYLDIVDAGGQSPTGLVPANLSATLGTNTATVTRIRQFQEVGEGVAYTFLVDVSKSISPLEFSRMQAAIGQWVARLRPVDWVAICAFGDDYHVVTDFKSDKQQSTSALAGLVPHDMQTHLYQAVYNAVGSGGRLPSGLPARRVVILLSDGKDEGSNITLQTLLNRLRITHVPVYAIGYSGLPGAQKRASLDVLRQLAELSGGVYIGAGAASFERVYAAVQAAVQRIFVVDLSCPKCVANSQAYPLSITLTQGGRSLSSSLAVTPLSTPNTPAARASLPVSLPFWRQIPAWAYAVVGLAAALVALFMFKRKGKPKPEEAPPVSPPLPDSVKDLPSKSTTGKGVPMKLAVVVGKDRGHVYNFQLVKTITIGRSKDCDVVLDDPKVSNRHCELTLLGNAVVMYDLDSKNSTYVKGVPIRGRHKMENEDSLLLGETELRLRFSENEVLAR